MRDFFRELFDRQKHSLDHFFRSVDLTAMENVFDSVAACRGAIVLSGVGKSGLIAQKIVATLVSTGIRAAFLCPSNALHGDIGILQPGDLFLAMSKSGASQELIDLMPYVQRKGIHSIAVVSTLGSKLEAMCSQSIYLPVLRELCPHDLAPTTSTTIQLLFGDVLSVALMHKKNIAVSDFAANHPGGLLGRKITYQVADLMFKGDALPLCYPTDKLLDVLHELSIKRCGCLLVIDEEGGLQGIFTDGDLRRAIQNTGPQSLEILLKNLMTAAPQSITPGELAIEAVRLMEERQITALPVLENGKMVGLIRMHDIIQVGLR